MSDPKVDLTILGNRIEAITAEVRDLQRRFTAIEARLGAMEQRFTAIEARIGGLETRYAAQEDRMTQMLAVVVSIARRVGVEENR